MKTSKKLAAFCVLCLFLIALGAIVFSAPFGSRAQNNQNNWQNGTIAFGTAGLPAYFLGTNTVGTIINSSFSQVVDVENEPGANNDDKWRSCWAKATGFGIICDDSRYTNTANNVVNWVTDPFFNHTTNTSYIPKGGIAILGQGLYNTAEPINQSASDTKIICSGSLRGTQVATSGCIIRATGLTNFGTKVFSSGTVNTTAGSPTVTANGGQNWASVFGADPTGWHFLINTSGAPCGGAGQFCVVYAMVTGFTAGVNGTLTLDRDAQASVATGTYTLTPPLFSQGFEGSTLFGVQTIGVGLDCNSFQTYVGGVGFERIAAEEDSFWKGGTATNCSGVSYYVASAKAQNSGPDTDLEFLSPSTGRPWFYTAGGYIGGKTQSSSGGEMTQWSGIGNLTINFQQNATPASLSDGTVTTTYGSKVITGAATLFSTNQQIGWWFATTPNAQNQMCFGQIVSIASDTSATLDRPCQASMAGGTAYTVRGCSATTTVCAAAGGGYFPATGLMINSRGGVYGGGLGRIHTERLGEAFLVGNNYTSTGGLTISNMSACNSASACGGTINGANAVIEIGTGVTDINISDVVPVGTTNDIVDNNQGPQGQTSQSTFITSANTTIADSYSIDKNGAGKWTRSSTSSEASTIVPSFGTTTECLLGGAAGTASPAACAAAASGKVAVPASQATYTVNNSLVTANSVIIVQQITDNSGLPSSPACSATATVPINSGRTAGTSFTITETSVASVTCFQYWIMN